MAEENEGSLIKKRPWWPRIIIAVAGLSLVATAALDGADVVVSDAVWSWVKYAIQGAAIVAGVAVDWAVGQEHAEGVLLLRDELLRAADSMEDATAPPAANESGSS